MGRDGTGDRGAHRPRAPVRRLPDPVGWLLVLTGLRVLPVAQRGTLLGLAGLALVASCVLWVPSVPTRLDDVDRT